MLRWGIMGTANIGRKNWKAIARSGNGRVTAVASRSMDAAQTFIDECQSEIPFASIPQAIGSYDELVARDDVDAVYIPLPTAMRKPWVLKAAAAGKHVLCEKPVAVTAADAQEMITACGQHGVQFMDGVMFMHSQRLQRLRATLLDAQQTGPIRRITSTFAFYGDEAFRRHNIRTKHQLEPHGCLGDLGWYNIRFTLWAMDYQLPREVVAHTHTALTGEGSSGSVPGELSAELFFANGASASFYCSFLTEIQQTAVISCERGHLLLEDFVLPFYGSEVGFTRHQHDFSADGCRFHMRRRSRQELVEEYADGEATAQEVNMVRRFAELADSGRTDPSWGQIAMATQRVLDACAASAAAGGRPTPVA
jgi:predicted dehydrogenase